MTSMVVFLLHIMHILHDLSPIRSGRVRPWVMASASSSWRHYVVTRDVLHSSGSFSLNVTFVLRLNTANGDVKILLFDPHVSGVWVCNNGAF